MKNNIYPLNPRYVLKRDEMDVSDPDVIYLGYDEPSDQDVWLAGESLRFTTQTIRMEIDIDHDPWNEHPQAIRQWIKRALDGGWLNDVFVLYKCEECGEIFVANPEMPNRIAALVQPPFCPECDSDKVVGQCQPMFRWPLAQWIVEEWGQRQVTGRDAKYQIMEIHFRDDYAESGYTLDEGKCGIAFGNWNRESRYDKDKNEFVTVDATPVLVGNLLGALGFELEWSDEWTECEGCYKALRTSPDCYCWQPSYYQFSDGTIMCMDCLDEAAVLEDLEGNASRAVNLIKPIDPEDHGYFLAEKGFEHGFHEGQDADPKVIAASLSEFDIERFLFMIDSVGQFDVDFSLYIHEDEKEKFENAPWGSAKKDGPSVSGAMKRALKEASVATQPKDGGVMVTCADASTGTATTVEISPEDFIAGRALDIAREAHKEQSENEE